MHALIKQVESKFLKKQVVDVRSGDTVKVYQRIKEGAKERVQMFEGLVIRTDRKDSFTSSITVRRISSGIGVEKSFLLHSPLIEKIEVVKRSKVRRKYLTYMRDRSGKSARLAAVDFDKTLVNDVTDPEAEAELARIHEEQKKEHEVLAAEKAAEKAELDANAAEVEARHKETEEVAEEK
jgi:large subunit ribosomal protein L19